MSVTARMGSLIPITLTVFRDEVTYININVVEEDGITPYDLTSTIIEFTSKWTIQDTDAAIYLSSVDSGEIAIIDAADGTLKLIFTADKTTDLPISTLELPYQISITDSGGDRFSSIFGTLRVLPNVTS